jgi:hypothetical protein
VQHPGPGATRITLRVHGLASPGSGHYELWLYNSIIDSRSLAVVRRVGGVDVLLPAGYRHFRWLDLSLQPRAPFGTAACPCCAPLPRSRRRERRLGGRLGGGDLLAGDPLP